jgi:hypothetical protein
MAGAATLAEPCVHRTFGIVDIMGIIRREFAEMPGMRLTRTQFRRLWDLTPDDAAFVIAELKRSGFLMEAEDGHLRRSDA